MSPALLSLPSPPPPRGSVCCASVARMMTASRGDDIRGAAELVVVATGLAEWVPGGRPRPLFAAVPCAATCIHAHQGGRVNLISRQVVVARLVTSGQIFRTPINSEMSRFLRRGAAAAATTFGVVWRPHAASRSSTSAPYCVLYSTLTNSVKLRINMARSVRSCTCSKIASARNGSSALESAALLTCSRTALNAISCSVVRIPRACCRYRQLRPHPWPCRRRSSPSSCSCP